MSFEAKTGCGLDAGARLRALRVPRALALTCSGALAAVALSGCQSVAVNAGNVATVKVVNASANSTGFDVYENSTALAYNVGFGYATSAVPLLPGSYTLFANQPGTQTHLAASSATLLNTHQYTVLIGNSMATLQESVLDNQVVAAPSGQLALRLIDQATHVGGVDVYLIPSSGTLSTTSPVATNLTFGVNSSYLNIPAGTYSLAVVPTGTVPVSSTTTLYTGPQVTYAAGAVRTVVLIDKQVVSTPALNALLLDDFDPAGTAN